MKLTTIYNLTFEKNSNIILQIPIELQTYISSLNLKQGLINRIYLFASIIIFFNQTNKIRDKFIPLHSKTLTKLFGTEYKKLINLLVDLQIIQVNNQYFTSAKHPLTSCSKKYRLQKRFLDSRIIPIQINDKKIYKRIEKIYSLKSDGEVQTYKPYKKLIKEKIDAIFTNNPSEGFKPEYKKDNETNIPSTIVSPTDVKFKGLYRSLNEIDYDLQNAREYIHSNRFKETNEKLNKMNFVCDLFDSNTPRIIKKQKSGRITSIITNMPKELRRFIKIGDSEELIMLDVSNFQPYILNLFIKKLGLENKQDSIQWLNLTAKGQIYEQLQDIYNAVYPDKRKKSRMQIKKELVSILNGPIKENNYFKDTRTDLYLLLEDLFPSVIQTLNEMKKNDYKDMSFLLQGAEARLMIDSIACKFAKENFILTVHDAVIIRRKDLSKFKRLFNSVFNKYFDKVPTLKMTNLAGEEIERNKKKQTKEVSEKKTKEILPENKLLRDVLIGDWRP